MSRIAARLAKADRLVAIVRVVRPLVLKNPFTKLTHFAVVGRNARIGSLLGGGGGGRWMQLAGAPATATNMWLRKLHGNILAHKFAVKGKLLKLYKHTHLRSVSRKCETQNKLQRLSAPNVRAYLLHHQAAWLVCDQLVMQPQTKKTMQPCNENVVPGQLYVNYTNVHKIL